MLNLRKVRIFLTICIWQLTAVPFLAAAAKSPQQTIAQNPAPSLCPSQLPGKIDAIVSRPQFRRQRWGILIKPLFSSQTLYSRDAEKYFVPASNAKLLITAAALHKLGADYRIRTSVYQDSLGVRVVGRGDPSLDPAQLQSLARQLDALGISRIKQLIGDDSYFQEATINPTWEWSDVQAGYGTAVNSLIVNENAIAFNLVPQEVGEPLRVEWEDPVEAVGWRIENNSRSVARTEPEFIAVGRDLRSRVLRVGGQLRSGAPSEDAAVAVVDPANNFLQHFRRALAAEGISVLRTAVTSSSQPPTREIAAVESPPLSELLQEINQWSNNLYTEALLRVLGATNQQEKNSLKVVKRILTELGVNPESYILTDAAGLSRHNLVTPEALVQTLQVMARSPAAAEYRASLAVAGGREGSLRSRFRGTPAEGMLQGKTGLLSGVAALSGYLDVPGYDAVVFSIIINQSDLSGAQLRQAIDEIIVLLTRLERC
ncbi:MAG: D-alanyl-D-alanine carboxypeptidase/D-alanyl-D-alanine-endopeptidase [Hormoscilla sp.]